MPTFQDLSFQIVETREERAEEVSANKAEKDSKKTKVLRVKLLTNFYFDIPFEEIKRIGMPEIPKDDTHTIHFPTTSEKKANNKFNLLIGKYIGDLKNNLKNRTTIYVHQNSGIPLMGTSFFGIIDRNTNCIEVKTITGCNLDCIYCSIAEGKSSKNKVEFVVEKDYIIHELKRIIEKKNVDGKPCDDIEIHIGVHGEPLLYAPLPQLIKDVMKLPQVKKTSMDTNGTMLTTKKIDELAEAGLTQLNLSLNAFTQDTADKVANTKYALEHVKKMATYAAKKLRLFISPTYLETVNNKEMEDIVIFAKEIGAELGIQNFLYYKYGRNPTEQISWDLFKERLQELEKKHNIKLLFDFKNDFNIYECRGIEKPFNKGDIIKATIVAPGLRGSDMIASCKNRSIIVPQCHAKIGAQVTLKVTGDKHNIFYASQEIQ